MNVHEAYDPKHDEFTECQLCDGTGKDTSMCKCEYCRDNCFCAKPDYVECENCDGVGGWYE